MKKLSMIGAGFLVLAAWGWVVAEDAKDRPARPLALGPCGGVVRALDADTNGELSADEIANASAALLELDANGDGALSGDELMPVPPPGRGGQRGPWRGPGRGPGRGMGRGEGPRGPGGGILRHDANDDGQVTLEEFTAGVTEMFNTLDADGDGVITEDEARPAPRDGAATTPGGRARGQRRGQ
jgi:hypothetical protein